LGRLGKAVGRLYHFVVPLGPRLENLPARRLVARSPASTRECSVFVRREVIRTGFDRAVVKRLGGCWPVALLDCDGSFGERWGVAWDCGLVCWSTSWSGLSRSRASMSLVWSVRHLARGSRSGLRGARTEISSPPRRSLVPQGSHQADTARSRRRRPRRPPRRREVRGETYSGRGRSHDPLSVGWQPS